MKKYNIIYADPAWSFKNRNTGGSMKSGANAKYKVMKLADMKLLPINDIAADDCALIMWWVGSQPQNAIALVESWGFKVKTMTGFTWVKMTKNWLMFFGMGFWTRAGSECALIAVKGKPKRVSGSVRSVIHAMNKKHSEKPAQVRDRIVELCGDVPRLELFARDKVDGWDAWGNEVESDVVL